ncbi:MAG: NADP-dependent isocitrate dehydrogenase [Synergistaceae bacterium]|nr:NADP-dependent isocitrate dehydrogenase [Synergistaceae bacterium]
MSGSSGRIEMKTPLVELDGDEMTRIIWADIKEILIEPFVSLKTEYYDLGLKHRDETDDSVTTAAAEAAKKYGVAVKCATITPNAQRMDEYKLKRMWRSPNATLRTLLNGTIFRTPIMASPIRPIVRSWKKPITIARHGYGDIYKATEMRVSDPGRVELVYTPKSGQQVSHLVQLVQEFEKPGIAMAIHNLDDSIAAFARSCFNYALSTRQDIWFSAKDTILSGYDDRFRAIFEEIFNAEYKPEFSKRGIEYFYTLIDDAVARVMRSEGGFIWGCKNYDGDVMSDMVATAFGSLAMMTSVLVSPDGKFEYEAAHGTVTRHYYRHLKGENTSTNSMATIFAWSGALRKRGEMDGISSLVDFAERLERASIDTIESGVMTQDLYNIAEIENKRAVSTKEFLCEIASRM